MSKRVAIFTGETSGDLQGAFLARALRQACDDLVIEGVGGQRMAAEGVRVIADSCLLGVIGPWEALGKLPRFIAIYERARRYIRDERPDLLVLIDAPALNMRLAGYARKLGIKSVYFFPPSAWTTNARRPREIAARVDRVITAFAYTAQQYEKAGCKAHYFGHPLRDIIRVPERDAIIQDLALPEGKRIVGLLPGSRMQEVKSLAPILVDSARLILKSVPDCHFVTPVANDRLFSMIERAMGRAGLPLTLVPGHGWEIMAVSDLLLMASGSASLEAAILGTPMLLVYKVPWPDWILGKYILRLRINHFGLPSLVLQRRAIPEFLQREANPQNLAHSALEILTQENVREKMKEDLRLVQESLGAQGVLERIAGSLKELLHG